MSTSPAEPDFVPSGFHHPDHRRVGGMSRKSSGEARQEQLKSAEMIGRVFVERSTRAQAIADALPALRETKKVTARSRIAAAPKKRKGDRMAPLGPTEARLAKGDMVCSGGVHRSAPPIEKLLANGSLDNDLKTANSMFFAAEKLKRHYDGSVNGVRSLDSLDIDAAMMPGGHSDLTGEEGWVHHHDQFKKARQLLGFYPDRPHHGCAGIVIAVVCEELSLRAAAEMCLPSQRTDRAQAIALDRLRSGLLSLAFHWKFL